MLTISQTQEIVKNTFDHLKISGNPKELYEPIDYIMSLGGKRLRPTLVLLANDLFDGKLDDAINPAIAMEIFHNFTLLHDDIMDKSSLRRGKPTVNVKWDDNIAILSGDAMCFVAYEYLVRTKPEKLNKILPIYNRTALEVCEGQQMDMNFEVRQDVALKEYLQMIALKTSVLIGACLKIGACIADASDNDAQEIYEFGLNMGIAFQLKDDLLDVYGDPSLFGKEVGKDILSNKKTFMLIKALEKAENDVLENLNYWIGLKEFDPQEKVKAVTDIFNLLQIDKETNTLINQYFDKAFMHLSKINVASSKKEALEAFCLNLKNRVH